MNVEAMVERVWPGREARVEVLGGGITNHNFKVDVDDERVRPPDRRQGHRACSGSTGTSSTRRRSRRAEAGVAPEVVAFVEPEG